jgi:acyl carrier protein
MATRTSDQIKDVVLRVLGEIAPEANLAALDPDVSVREQLDLDSFDFLNFVIGLSEALGLEVPEVDYPKVTTLNDCIAYASAAQSAARPAASRTTSGKDGS